MEEKTPTPETSLDVHGYSVIYDENSRIGIDYLNNLSYEEAKAIFDQSASSGETTFKDGNGYGYKLVCNYGDVTKYTITRKY